MSEARTNLSRIVAAVETGLRNEIIITRNGLPAARLVPVADVKAGVRLGLAKGKFVVPDDIDARNREIARLFEGGA